MNAIWCSFCIQFSSIFPTLSRCLPGIGSTAAGPFFLISQCYATSEKRLGQPSLWLVDVVQDLSAIMWV